MTSPGYVGPVPRFPKRDTNGGKRRAGKAKARGGDGRGLRSSGMLTQVVKLGDDAIFRAVVRFLTR